MLRLKFQDDTAVFDGALSALITGLNSMTVSERPTPGLRQARQGKPSRRRFYYDHRRHSSRSRCIDGSARLEREHAGIKTAAGSPLSRLQAYIAGLAQDLGFETAHAEAPFVAD